MNSPRCQYDCPPDFSFCPKCGTNLDVECSQCGFTAPVDFTFCPKCGNELRKADQGEDAGQVGEELVTTGLMMAVQRLISREYAELLREAGGEYL